MVVPNDVLRLVLAQDGQHNAHLLPAFLFWSVDWLFEQVVHPVLVDLVHLVYRQEGTALIVSCSLL